MNRRPAWMKSLLALTFVAGLGCKGNGDAGDNNGAGGEGGGNASGEGGSGQGGGQGNESGADQGGVSGEGGSVPGQGGNAAGQGGSPAQGGGTPPPLGGNGVPYLTRAIDKTGWGAPFAITVPAGLTLRVGGTPLATTPKLADGPIPQHTGLTRTLALLSGSTPQKHNKVKILFYGQSITRQPWFETVSAYLKTTYPNADIEIAMLASGGQAANKMRRASEHDVIPMYPDLIIYQNYGDYLDIDAIIQDWRRRTTAEVMLQSWHLDSATGDSFTSIERMSYLYMPNVCTRLGCEYLDLRTPWKEYVKSKNYPNAALTSDGIHLNDEGLALMAKLVNDMFKNVPAQTPVDPLAMVSTWPVGPGQVPWQAGKLVVDFDGNRIDVVAAVGAKIAAGAATVLIDGKKPSEFKEAFAFTRPNGNGLLIDKPEPGWPWALGAPMRIDFANKLVVEDWTLSLSNVSGSNFNYTVAGSVTGADGSGSRAAAFRSTSGRVVIASADWATDGANNAGFNISTNKVVWKAIALHTDSYPPAPLDATDATREFTTTLIQGISNGKHRLELTATGGQPLPVAALRVFRPPLK